MISYGRAATQDIQYLQNVAYFMVTDTNYLQHTHTDILVFQSNFNANYLKNHHLCNNHLNCFEQKVHS